MCFKAVVQCFYSIANYRKLVLVGLRLYRSMAAVLLSNNNKNTFFLIKTSGLLINTTTSIIIRQSLFKKAYF